MNKLSPEQLKEANALLKVLVIKTREHDPDAVASAVIGLMARMCYIAASGEMPRALQFVENMALDVQTMLFNLHTAYTREREQNETDQRLRD